MSDPEPTAPAWNQPFTVKECQATEQWLKDERRTEPSSIIDPKIEAPLPGVNMNPAP